MSVFKAQIVSADGFFTQTHILDKEAENIRSIIYRTTFENNEVKAEPIGERLYKFTNVENGIRMYRESV